MNTLLVYTGRTATSEPLDLPLPRARHFASPADFGQVT